MGSSYKIPYQHVYYPPEKQVYQLSIYYKDGTVFHAEPGKDFMPPNISQPFQWSGTYSLDLGSLNNNQILVTDQREKLLQAKAAKAVLFVRDRVQKSLPKQGNSKQTPIIPIDQKLYQILLNQKENIDRIEMNLELYSKKITAYNIAGKLEGHSSDQAIVVSAHFDHVGWMGDTIYHGAVDNITGVAVMLKIAEDLSAYSKENELASDIIFIAFNGEESNLQGSQSFVKNYLEEYSTIYNINLDSLGTKDSQRLVINGDETISKTLADELKVFLKQHDFITKTSYPGGTSDHIAFTENGLSSVTLGSENISMIHTPEDNLNQIDFQQLNRITEALYQFILEHQDAKAFSFEMEHNHSPARKEKDEGPITFEYKFDSGEKLGQIFKMKFPESLDHKPFSSGKLTVSLPSSDAPIVLSAKYFESISLVYQHPGEPEFFQILISKKSQNNDKNTNYTEEVLEIDGIAYTLYRKNDRLIRIEREARVNGEPLEVHLTKGTRIIDEDHKTEDIMADFKMDKEQDIVLFIKDLNIEPLAEHLLGNYLN